MQTDNPEGTSVGFTDLLDGDAPVSNLPDTAPPHPDNTVAASIAVQRVTALIDNADFGDYDGLAGAVRTSDLRDAIGYPVVGADGTPVEPRSWEPEEQTTNGHRLEEETDGDGWNEPFTFTYSCACGVQFAHWVQTDRDCTGQPSLIDEVVPAYTAHLLDERTVVAD